MARLPGQLFCLQCQHIACVCGIKRDHAPQCKFRLAAMCSVGIECKHGFDVCPECDRCTCTYPMQFQSLKEAHDVVVSRETGVSNGNEK